MTFPLERYAFWGELKSRAPLYPFSEKDGSFGPDCRSVPFRRVVSKSAKKDQVDNLLTWCLGKQPIRHQAGKPSRHSAVWWVRRATRQSGRRRLRGGICRASPCAGSPANQMHPACAGVITEEEAQHPESNPSSFPSTAHRVVIATNMLRSKPNIWQVAAHS